jgi:putative thioredoxin
MQPSDYSTHSAVDLGARKAAMEREAKRQSAQSSGTASQFSIDVTEQNFQTDVLERSTQVPVVLALLAGWSEQSQQVERALDRLVAGAGGQWYLAKVDTEASPQLAQALRVPQTPMVAMVIGGQVVPGPVGPANEEQLREWLTQIFDGLRQQGVLPENYSGLGPEAEQVVEDEGEPDSVHTQAHIALQRGDLAAAEAAYAKALEADSSDAEAKAGLAYVRLGMRVQGQDPAEVRRAADADRLDVAAQCRMADLEMVEGRAEEAFQRMVDTVRATRDADRDEARTHLLGLFEVLPPSDPRLAKARRALTSALF